MSHIVYEPPASVVPFLTGEKFAEFIIGPVGCIHGDTLVITEDGAVPISSIDRPVRVLSWNEKTCRFQLSWCGGSFPKGRDYLYRVSTPQGEFDAAGQHLLLCADGKYRRVEELRRGDVLASYSHNPVQTSLELCRSESPSGAPHYSETDVDFLGYCAELSRLRGQRFLSGEDSAQGAAPSPDGVQKSPRSSCPSIPSRAGDRVEPRQSRTQRCSHDVRSQTGGWQPRSGCHSEAEAVRGARVFSERVLGVARSVSRSLSSLCYRWRTDELSSRILRFLRCGPYNPPSVSTSDRPIVSITRLEVKEAYWDMQVEDTHNYVTVDGAIHHNSTKTTAAVMKIAYHAQRMRKSRDGIRRSRCAWIRNTREQLRDTSLPSFLTWFPDGQAGVLMKSEMKFLLKFDDVECEVLFRGLDDANDVRRLLSLELSFAVLDETREISPAIYDALTARLGRYPSKIDGGCVDDEGRRNDRLWGATNPPDVDTHWEELFSNPPDNVGVTFQPSGLSEEADWRGFLPEGYYENIAQGKTQDWIDVYIHAKFGRSLAGKPVFRSFDREVHVAKKPLMFNPISSNPLVVGMDTALHPSAVIGQVGYNGRLNIFHSIHAADMGALRFVREHLKPLLANRFGGAHVIAIIDPAGMQRSQADESTVADILRAEGIMCKPASTNSIAGRIAAVDSFLTRTVDGAPAFQIDPEHNGELIQALGGKYRFRIKQNGETEEKPEKTRPWADLCDGLEYLCLHADGGATFGRQIIAPRAREIKKVESRGWT